MTQSRNSKRYKRLHDWYYIYRDTASDERLELNFQIRQKIILECLDDALDGVPLPRVIIKDLKENLSYTIDGYYSQLLTPVNIGRGAQELHKVESTMIGRAVNYIFLNKSKVFKRTNHMHFVGEVYGVSRETVRDWYNDDRFEKWKENPFSNPSQEHSESMLIMTGDIYKNNRKARKKA